MRILLPQDAVVYTQRPAYGSALIPGGKQYPVWTDEVKCTQTVSFVSLGVDITIARLKIIYLKYMFSHHVFQLCQSMVYNFYWIYVIFIWNWPWSYTLWLDFNTVQYCCLCEIYLWTCICELACVFCTCSCYYFYLCEICLWTCIF